MSRFRRSAKQIAREISGRRRNPNQLWLTVGVAVVALVSILLFRQSCAKRMGKFYETLSPPGSTHKAGRTHKADRRPPREEPAPMQAPGARPEGPGARPATAARPEAPAARPEAPAARPQAPAARPEAPPPRSSKDPKGQR